MDQKPPDRPPKNPNGERPRSSDSAGKPLRFGRRKVSNSRFRFGCGAPSKPREKNGAKKKLLLLLLRLSSSSPTEYSWPRDTRRYCDSSSRPLSSSLKYSTKAERLLRV